MTKRHKFVIRTKQSFNDMKFCDQSNTETKCFVGKFKNKRHAAIADREQELLIIAEKLMEHEGFSGLTMDKLVAACNYSKGTVYNHFNSKEDLLCALCIKGIKLSMQLMRRALTFEGNTREKNLAIHFANRVFGLASPTLFMCILSGKSPAVQEKASTERLKEIDELEVEITAICDQTFSDALNAGDLNVSMGVGIDGFSFANWAMSFGSNALMIGASEANVIKSLDLDFALLFNVSIMMDGMGWKPLSHQWDYKQTWQRIATEVFSKEMAALGR